MAARDRFDRNFECKQCGETGKVNLSENDYPFMRKAGREVDSVEGNIIAAMNGEVEVIVTCKSCGTTETWYEQPK